MVDATGSGRGRPSWAEHALNIAEAAALRSQDQHYQVGACVLRPDHSVASVGYNGAPSGIDIDWSDRDTRRLYVIHAEANALRWSTPAEVAGGLIATTHLPCEQCVRTVASYGIDAIHFRHSIDPEVYDLERIWSVAGRLGVVLIQHL